MMKQYDFLIHRIPARLFLVFGIAITMSLNVFAQNAPTGADDAIDTDEETDRVITSGDFTFSDAIDGNTLDSVVLVSVVAANGTLFYDLNNDDVIDGSEPLSATDALSIDSLTSGKFKFRPDVDFFGDVTFDFQLLDDGPPDSLSITYTMTITVNNINDQPVLSGSPTVSLTDIDEDNTTSSGDLISAIVTSLGANYTDADGDTRGLAITGIDETNGNWQYKTGASNWTDIPSVSPTSALLLANDGDNAVRFQPNSDYNGGSGNITFVGWDETIGSDGATGVNTTTGGATGSYSSGSATASLNVDPLDDPPTIANLAGDALAYTEGDGVEVIEQGGNATISDVDGPADFDGGSLTVTITNVVGSEDVLSIQNVGTGVGQIGFSVGTVTFEGNTIGTVSGPNDGSSGNPLVVSLSTANSTLAAVSALIQNITYENTNVADIDATQRTVRFVVNNGQASANNDAVINITPVNSEPEITGLPTDLTFDEDVSGNVDLSAATFSDSDAGSTDITLTLSVDAGTLSASGSGGVTVTGSPGSSITLEGTATQIDTYLNTASNISYLGASDDFGTNAATLSLSANDGFGSVALGTVSIDIDAVNDPPTFVLGANQNRNSSEGSVSITNFVTSISTGPGEGSQSIDDFLVSNNNNGLFDTQPDVANNGTLSFVIADNAEGFATVNVQLRDDGGTPNGGSDTSPVQQFTITITDNQPPSLQTVSFDPADGSTGITILDARTIEFSFDENVVGLNSGAVQIFEDTDLVTPVFEVDGDDADISISGSDVIWNLDGFLTKSTNYIIAIESGAFQDTNGNAFTGLANTGENSWNFQTTTTSDPRFVFSPQDGQTNVSPTGLIQFFFDEDVRAQNSATRNFEVDIIDGFSGSVTSNNVLVINMNTGDPSFTPAYPGFSNEHVFNVASTTLSSFNTSTFYRITIAAGAFEDSPDNDSDQIIIEFQTSADATLPTLSSSNPTNSATVNASLDEIILNFDKTVQANISGQIRLFADLNPDVEVFEVDSDDPLVAYSGNTVTIDISSVTLSGGVDYYLVVEPSAITDDIGNGYAGLTEGQLNFTVDPLTDNEAPIVTNRNPADNDGSVAIDSDITITFSEPIFAVPDRSIFVRYSNSDILVQEYLATDLTINGNEFTLTLDEDFSGQTSYYVNIENGAFEDQAGNSFPGILGKISYNFTTEVENIDPVPVGFTPADGSTDVAVFTDLVLELSEPVGPLAGNSIEIRNDDIGGDPIVYDIDVTDARVEYEGPFVTINDIVLDYDTRYFVTIASGAFEDASGNLSGTIGGNGVWEFDSELDLIAPEILELTPDDDEQNVVPGSVNISIKFNEPVDLSSGTDSVKIFYENGVKAAFRSYRADQFSLSNADSTASILGVQLDGNQEYYIQIDAGAFEDKAGNAFAGISNVTDWSFSTDSDLVPPLLLSNSPSNGAGSIDLSEQIRLIFNEFVFNNSGSLTITNNTLGETDRIINFSDALQVDGVGQDSVLVFDLSQEFRNNTNYTISYPAGALQDASGNDVALLSSSFTTGAASVVSPASAIICTNGDFTSIGSIRIDESNNDDFVQGNGQTIVLTLPAQFEFDQTAIPNVSEGGSGISNQSITSITANTLTITYDASSGSESSDNFITIDAGLRIRYTGSTIGAFETYRTGGSANQKGNQSYHFQNYITLTTQNPPPVLIVGAGQGIDEAFSATAPGDVVDDDLAMYTRGNILGNEAAINVLRITPISAAYELRIYSDEGETTQIAGSPFTGSSNYDFTIDDFGLTGNDLGITTFYVTQIDPEGCESDAVEYSIAIADFSLSPNTISFSEDDGDGTTLTANHPAANHTKQFSGDGLANISYGANTSSARFVPSAAGTIPDGTLTFHDILIKLTNTNTGVSAPFLRTFRVNPVSTVFGGGFDNDRCEDESVLNLTLTDPDGGGNSNGVPDFNRLRYFAFKSGVRGPEVTGTIGLSGTPAQLFTSNIIRDNIPGNLNDWSIDITAYNLGDGGIDTIEVAMYVVDELTDVETQYATELLFVYPVPQVTINNVNDYYCEDDASINVEATITTVNGINTQNISNGYILYRSADGIFYSIYRDFRGITAVFDPTDPDQDGNVAEDETGFFRIEYTTPELTAAQCTTTEIVDFQILPTPAEPTISTNLDFIGGFNGSKYVLEYCEGKQPGIINAVGDSITWYIQEGNNLNVLTSISGNLDLRSVIGPAAGTDNTTTIFFSNKTNANINSSGFEGCESNLVEVEVREYETPPQPEVITDDVNFFDLGNNSYTMEYCDGDPVGNIVLTNADPNYFIDSRSYVRVINQQISEATRFKSLTYDLETDFNITPVAGLDTTIYFDFIEHDSAYALDPNYDFSTNTLFNGCNSSPLTRLRIRIYEVPDAPVQHDFSTGRADYYLCSGDNLPIIETPRLDGSVYEWFAGDASVPTSPQITVSAFNDQFINQTELESAGFSNINNSGNPITYYFYVNQTTDVNATSGYEGCTGDFTRVSITVYPDPPSPLFEATGTDELTLSFCEGEINDEIIDLGVSGDDQFSTFRWYESDQNGVRLNPNDPVFESDSGTVEATQFNLQFVGENPGPKYYVVSQVNNINVNGSSFPGCETEEVDMAFLTLNIFDIPSQPNTAAGIFEFCEEDVFLNGIQLVGEGNPDEVFEWYRDDDADGEPDATPFYTGDFANSTNLGLQGNLGIDEYNFWVSQRQDIDGGIIGFVGCESPLRQINIYEIPNAPTPADQDKFVCVGDPVPSFAVSANVGIVNWYDTTGVLLASGANIDPINISNVPAEGGNTTTSGVYFLEATQTTNSEIIGFDGCESDTTTFSLTVYDVPSSPVTTAVANEYVICEGDVIPTFEILNPDTAANTVYTWYDELGNQVATGRRFNPLANIDLDNLLPGQPNEFDFEVEITTNINAAENFFGCTSPITNVVLRINGEPDTDFENIVTNNAYCIEEGQVTISADGNITGAGANYEFSLFNDFSQVGNGLSQDGTGNATLDFDEMHLSQQPSILGGEPSFHNIYFRYTDVNGCVALDSVTNIRLDPDPDINFRVSQNSFNENSAPPSPVISGDTIEVCVDQIDETQINLQGILTVGSTELSSGNFSGFGVSASNNTGAALFESNSARETDASVVDPLYDNTTDYQVTYDYTDENGCRNTRTKVFVVHPVPQLVEREGSIITNRACAADFIDFEVRVENMAPNEVEFEWRINNTEVEGQRGPQITIESSDPTYNITVGEADISVKAINVNTGCSYFVSESKNIGQEPKPTISWDNLTIGGPTTFSFAEVENQLSAEDLLRLQFDIYRGTDVDADQRVFPSLIRDIADSSNSAILNLADTIYIFNEAGTFTAELFIETRSFCEKTEVRTFNIIPKDVVPTSGDGLTYTFNNGAQQWFTDSINIEEVNIDGEIFPIGSRDDRLSTWEVTPPGGEGIEMTPLDGNAWVTDGNSVYGDENGVESENSWVYSPSLDFSALSKPTLRLNYFSELDTRDGVVIQVSTDDGESWAALGDFNPLTSTSGIEWYNAENISGSPGNTDNLIDDGFNVNRVGWTGRTEAWKTAIHQLDYKVPGADTLLIPRAKWNNVRFRVALGTRASDFKEDQNGNLLEGFAFDNFQVYDRDRIVLAETFSTSLFDKSKEAEEEVYNRLSDNQGVVWINYFTDLYTDPEIREDILFNRNRVAPSARVAYYGIENVPTSVIAGQIRNNADVSQSGNLLLDWNINDLNRAELQPASFEIELIENGLSRNNVNVTGSFTAFVDVPQNEEVSVRFAVIEENITGIEVGEYFATDTIRNVLRRILPDPGGFVIEGGIEEGDEFNFTVDWDIFNIFDADELSVIAFVQNEITKEIYQAAKIDMTDKVFDRDVIANVEQSPVIIKYYPNPVDKKLNVDLNIYSSNLKWEVYDQSGRRINSGQESVPVNKVEIETENIANGVYFLKMTGESIDVFERFIIQHQ